MREVVEEEMEMNWNYIAGFFDADGSVLILHDKRRDKTYFQLSFANTNIEVLERIKKFIKTGNIYRDAKKPNCKQGYNLKIPKHQAVRRIARELIPRTIIKKSKLISAVEAIKARKWHHNLGAYYRLKPLMQKESVKNA